MSVAVRFHNVCIMFGDSPAPALARADAGETRAEIQAATGHVLGVHDCTLSVEEGEILVLMGLSGSGKSTLLRAVNGLNPVVRGERLLLGAAVAALMAVPVLNLVAPVLGAAAGTHLAQRAIARSGGEQLHA